MREMQKITGMGSGSWGLTPALKKTESPATCHKHGSYTSVSYIEGYASGCPECQKEAEAEASAARAAEYQRLAVKAKLRDAGIPARFALATLESFVADSRDQKDALKAAMKYAADFSEALVHGRCLAFVGPPGTGKTHLAVGIVREILAQGHSALITTVGDYVREIKDQCWGKDKESTESVVIAKYRAPDLLVLDEVGVQFGSQTEENLIFTLINKRYEDLKPTLVISNEVEDGLEKYLGRRTFDRLKDGGGLIIPFPWESYRG